jgi:hypothetical protein
LVVIRLLSFAFFALLLATEPLSAQNNGGGLLPPTGTGEVSGTALLAINMAIGGITAGAWRLGTGRPFWNGFARGAAAGATVFAGKRLIAEEKPWTWWAGRGVAALGSAEVRNAAESRQFMERAAIPLGPIRFHISREPRFRSSVRLDLATSIAAAYAGIRKDTRLGWRESLSSGAFVFLSPDVPGAVGSHSAGVVILNEFIPDGKFIPLERKRGVLTHELIHATQYDFMTIAWGDPLEDAIARRVPALAIVHRYVDLGILVPVHAGVNNLLSPPNRPWEKEASSFASGY